MATNTTARWSPVTKIAILGAAIAVPYLLWTAPDSGTPAVARPPARAAEEAGTGPAGAAVTAAAPTEAAARRRALPPLQAFAAVVERPLFAPTRRFVRPVDPQAPEPEAVAEVEEAPPEPEATGPERPDLRFFGTVRQGGKMAALVTGESGVERLRVGDTVGDWQVTEVTGDRLVLVHEDERLAYEIFGKAAANAEAGED
jgi:hypothetical protein